MSQKERSSKGDKEVQVETGLADIQDYIKSKTKEIDDEIRKYLTEKTSDRYIKSLLGNSGFKFHEESIDKSIMEPIIYLLNMGGKRLRPIMTLLTMEAFGKKGDDFVEFAIVPEIVHTGTLIHDDMEDKTDFRRGSLAVHKKFGEDIALNVGDFLFFFPLGAVIDSRRIDIPTKYAIVSELMRTMRGLGLGQGSDLAWHNNLVEDASSIKVENYMQMCYGKTGALTSFSMKLGAILAGAKREDVEKMGLFGGSLGVAFQIEDDILNLRKNKLSDNKGGVGDDITEGKMTLMAIYAMNNAPKKDSNRLLEILKMHTKDKKLIDEAINILESSGAIEFADRTKYEIISKAWKEVESILPDSESKMRMRQLAEMIVHRSV